MSKAPSSRSLLCVGIDTLYIVKIRVSIKYGVYKVAQNYAVLRHILNSTSNFVAVVCIDRNISLSVASHN